VELYLHYPNTSSWRGDQLKKAQGHLYLYLLWTNSHGTPFHSYCTLILTVTRVVLNFLSFYGTRVHNCPPAHPILSKINPFHTLAPYFFKIHFNIILPIDLFSSGSTCVVCISQFFHACYMSLFIAAPSISSP
jgi:hypothetical protein